MRYFYVTYTFTTSDGRNGWGSIDVGGECFPNRREIQQIALAQLPKIDFMVITNIIEFKNEQDYNDFVK